ncbi:MAG: hypothetical protein H6922_02475 [Pseudomonadaceae bacterium]|nr:hypothetical protein [Pseudomonadaceae bacterium]
MRFCLLTRFHSQHGQSNFVRRLVEEANARGHAFDIVNPEEVTLQFGQGAAPVMWRGQEFPHYDLVHYALRWDDDHTWNIVETLRSQGIHVLPPQRVPMGDTVTMTRLFARAEIATPRTWVFNSANQLAIVLGELPFPCLFRVRKGAQGRRVFVANHTGEAMQLAEALGNSGHPFLVQEVLAPTGTDIRAYVVGGEVVAAIERVAPPGFMWPKEDGNARAVPVTLTDEEAKLAVAAARVYSAPYAAVSLLRRQGFPSLLLELARAPTVAEVERATGVNVAGKIIEFCVEKSK